MRPFARILALTAVALLLAAGGAWACCDNGLVDCCDMASHSVSEHCPETQVMTMNCGLDHAVNAATGAVNAKSADPSLVARNLASTAAANPTHDGRSAALRSATAANANANAELYTLHATLRL